MLSPRYDNQYSCEDNGWMLEEDYGRSVTLQESNRGGRGSNDAISSCHLNIIYLIYFQSRKLYTYTYITSRSMTFHLISVLTISQMRLTAIFSHGVKPVAGSGTSKAWFEAPPDR
jgi:hypothetical protein